MKSTMICVVLVASLLSSEASRAQSTDDLLKDRALLRAEMERCKRLGMASNDDPRCRTAWTAEQKRFFGNGVGYTNLPVNVFPNHQDFDPKPDSQKTAPSNSGPPHG